MIGEPVTQENEISMIGKPEPERSATAYSNGAEVKLSRAFHVVAEDHGIAYRATVVVDDQIVDADRGSQPLGSAANHSGAPERWAVRCRLAAWRGVRRLTTRLLCGTLLCAKSGSSMFERNRVQWQQFKHRVRQVTWDKPEA